MNYVIMYSTELYHHGVKGMRWGVRKEYKPVGRKQSASKQESSEKKKKGLTRNQKIALGVAAVAVTGVVLYKTGQFDRLADIGKKALGYGNSSGPPVDKLLANGFSEVEQTKDAIESFFETNEYHNKLLGSDSNCMGCAIADWLKEKKGIYAKASMAIDIDPVSGLSTKRNWRFKDVEKAFPGTHTINLKSTNTNDLRKELLRLYKEGDSGVFGTTFVELDGTRTRHAIKWSIENGKVRFSDSQYAVTKLKEATGMGVDANNAKRVLHGALSDLSDSFLDQAIDFKAKKHAINLEDAKDIIPEEVRKFVY